MTTSRAIRDDGTPELTWLPWLRQSRFTTRSRLTGWGGRRRLVVLAPHPDDEVLSCGAALARHRPRGHNVLVVVVTDGERSHLQSAHWRQQRLASQRRRESSEGLRRLGLPACTVIRLGLPDGRVKQRGQALLRHLRALLRPTDTVVTTWRWDGHPDHEACGRCAARICCRSGARLLESPVWMWHWAEPGDRRVPWQRLRGVSAGADALKAKQCAVLAHRSQLADRGPGLGPVLNPAIVERARRSTEYFIC